MFIQTEATPNPATLKFLPGRVVLDGTLEMTDREQAAKSPLAEKLFDVPNVSGVFFGSDFITVTKAAGEWQQLKPMISQTFEQDFQFAAANRWFEKTVGNPLAFLTDKKEGQKDVQANQELAVPASGKVQESFTQNGAGVKVETSAEAIDSMKEGYVVEVKKKSDTGLTVVVQHADNSYSWYGQLKEADVALYDFVDKGEKIGQIALDKQGKGTYYFAIKQNEQFIDPIQVMTFE